MSKRKYLEEPIKGKTWKVFVQTNSAYIRMHGKDSHAVAYPIEREMYFNKSDVSLRLIRHEVFHAYTNSTDTEYTSKMTAADQEELDCTVYGNNADEIAITVANIVDYILKGGQ